MRVLTPTRLCVLAVALAAVLIAPSQVAAHPPDSSDHGVNESTYCTLWNADTDTGQNVDGELADNESDICSLAAGTDIPTNTPPPDIERWNRGDIQEFPATNASHSIHPPDANLTNGTILRDAYIELFAVQPSTRAHVASNATPLFVAPNGTVLATVDYRVALSSNHAENDTRVRWQRRSHDIEETRLYINGTLNSTNDGSHTLTHNYSLSAPNRQYTFRLEADITVSAQKRIAVCEARENGTCTQWENSTATTSETVTVHDSLPVRGYQLDVSGVRAAYPNGDLGLLVYKNRPWLGYDLPNGEVHGVWRFYSARDTDWDTLVTSTEDGSTRSHSPIHPLQTNAYPFEAGATVSSRANVSIIETYGETVDGPTLPEHVYLDSHTGPYEASYGIATRAETIVHNLSEVTAYGLVRGSSVDASTEPFADVDIHRSNLTLSVVNRTNNTVTVRANLTDVATGKPINTTDTAGTLIVQGRRVNTSNGTVVVALTNPVGGISARYEPQHWWRAAPGHTGDTAVVGTGGWLGSLLAIAFRFSVLVGLFLFAGFLIDRVTGASLWPPWRGLS